MHEVDDYAQPIECDVAIVGAEMSALVAGAILAKHGRRVVVVDSPPVTGGRGGSVPFRGWWLDCGHRLGSDVTDLEIGWIHGQEACREADVEVRIREMQSHLRVHLIPEFPPRPAALPAQMVYGDWSPEGFVPLARDVLGVPVELMSEFSKVMERIAGSTAEEQQEVVEVPLGEWVEQNVDEPEIRAAVLTMAKTIYCQYPERASTGRIMGFFATRHTGLHPVHGFADDDEAGGMQGAIAPFERALVERGGRVILSHQPVEITFDGERSSGFVAINDNHLALEVRAPVSVISYPIWSALPLLPPERRDAELVSISERLEDHCTDAIGLQIGLSRMPVLRDTGEVETHTGWNRLLIGPDKHFRGGFHFPSLSSRAAAPAGKHLLHCLITRWLRRDERIGWDETKATADAARRYLSSCYADFDDCVEWEARQWVQRPAVMGWFWAPVRRHGVRVPGCPGLYLANSTIESDAGPVDISAQAGMQAARAILADG
ncbi:MAG: NAD(P)-binding protein [Myxococcales bacterium]|nr:NAD(P)-binding protein [Myxococcales bacterium]